MTRPERSHHRHYHQHRGVTSGNKVPDIYRPAAATSPHALGWQVTHMGYSGGSGRATEKSDSPGCALGKRGRTQVGGRVIPHESGEKKILSG